MATSLIFLGTGNALVTKCYNTCFALQNGDEFFLTDAGGGNGILAQLEKARIPLPQIRSLFVTHGHTDHILGVIWVIRLAASLFTRGKHPGLTIYCHDECEKKLRAFCQMTLTAKLQAVLDNGVRFVCLQDGDSFQAAGFACTAFDIHSTKTKQFGYRAVLPDGQTLVCLGDEPYNPACQRYAQQADWLLSEAFCLFSEREQFKPYEKHHSTARDAACTAAQLGAKNLVLYHTQDNCLPERKRLYTAEARQCFSGPVYVPDDLQTIVL
ncbi:MBL fold metallo-hydrolase [Candidatus Avelusimicrobium gallicola]|uniref:MBL fold metallo-hydrolase n=1 Tax=Candidatus Avelusimicrobium gallicola TaxID=2562704 RepID=A0A1Y4DI39_9BACT|nr:MBL fold metallo-hydrolase [Elusimicrobium sp. An273]OUO57329.1 MBL fold metallo-hydrolase [Elusimicrobium sp. An273]